MAAAYAFLVEEDRSECRCKYGERVMLSRIGTHFHIFRNEPIYLLAQEADAR